MCDQTEVSYLENDIVWVKIGPIWWPGVVKDLEKDDEGKEILAGLKKKPIAAVKFFEEDNYEFVKNLEHIYHYNCRRKDEFIKKGLDKFRTGATHMKKFPADVTTAESLVNGDVDIINDPKFYPEKRLSYSEIFGSGKKKGKKDSETHPKPKLNTSSNRTPHRTITHQRFINKVLHGESDHKVRTLIQPTSSPDDVSRGLYRCHMCKFETARVNVIVDHHRLAHSPGNSINWIGSDNKAVKRKPTFKSRKSKTKKLLECPRTDSSDDEFLDKKKIKIKNEKSLTPDKTKDKSSVSRKRSVHSRKRKTSENAVEDNQKKPKYTDVLLADWSEDDEDERNTESRLIGRDDDPDNENTPESPTDSSDIFGKNDMSEVEKRKEDTKNLIEKKSCFDFDEEEEGFIGMSNANTYGRKIPRVIPMKDKTELGVDMEIGELFKKKSESDSEPGKDDIGDTVESKKTVEGDSDKGDKIEIKNKGEETENEQHNEKLVKRRRKSSKDTETRVDEESLAVRRTRRPGAKKSYLNEVIEKVEDVISTSVDKIDEPKDSEIGNPNTQNILVSRKALKDDAPSSTSRRKQDLKLQAMETPLDDTVYTEIVNTESKNTENTDKKARSKAQQGKSAANEDLTKKIEYLLAETNVPVFPEIPTESKQDISNKCREISKSSSTMNLSFDYISPECDEKAEKVKSEVKSITKMFCDTAKTSEKVEEKDHLSNSSTGDSGKTVQLIDAESKRIQSQNLIGVKILSSPGSSVQKVESSEIILQNSDKQEENSEDDSTAAGGTSEKVSTEISKKVAEAQSEETEEKTFKTKNIKTLKLKADSLPSTLLSSAGKLKGQTIIHQKGGTYVILSQPPQIPRQKIGAGKGQTPGKLVILTNQHGEQKIITTSGLQQSKFKIDPQKSVVVAPSGGSTSSDGNATSGIISVGKTQPIIKMVPDGKGGVVKQLTVSPKKVLVGGTKMLVSGASSTFSNQGSTIQKIALTSGNNLSGDYRLIENYKGSGKTVLIQGGSNTGSSVLLKTAPGVQRNATGETLQNSPNILSVKKKPKILMRATPAQNEYVVQSEISTIDTPTYVMKRKGVDGKFSTQKIIRRPVVNPVKAKTVGNGSKTIILSSEQPLQKAESIIITTNHEPDAKKIIRLKPKVRETDLKPKFSQKIIQKTVEGFSVADNSILTAVEPEGEESKSESSEIMQVQQNQAILQTQVMAMPGPIGSDGNQTYVLVSVDEHGVVQPVENSLIAYDTSGPSEAVFMNQSSDNNVIVINPQSSEEIKPMFSNGSQDILAEALANTNVLDGNMNSDMDAVMPTILLPPSIPSSVVQETSITLQKPIMTPLEMPTSVTPDTSGLEPPPLPPTPTEEDVLMEDHDGILPETGEVKEEELITTESSRDQNKKPESFTEFNICTNQAYKIDGHEEELGEERCESGVVNVNSKEDDYASLNCGQTIISEHCAPEEEQGQSSLQSMPLLNDEPDTSDDAQSSEQIIEQDLDLQKSRSKSDEISQTLRQQEPPSSTNNEVNAESNFEKSKSVSNCEIYRSELQGTTVEESVRNTEGEKTQEDSKMKDLVENGDMQSMPVITDEGGVNSCTFSQMYVDALSQKRFQEETEVTSTTDEFSKDGIA